MLNTLSVTTTPPMSSATPRPMTVTIGTAALPSAWTQQHVRLGLALGARGADVVLLEHFEHAGAGDAGDQRDEDRRECERRQRDVADEQARIDERAAVALYRKPAQPSANSHRSGNSP